MTVGKSRKNFTAFVLLPPDAKQAIDLLIGTRESVAILPSNPYVFALLSANNPMSGYVQMQDVLHSCGGLRHPERINSHGLRRYIATVTQVTHNVFVISIPTSLWSSSRILPWSSTLHLIHHSSQHCHIHSCSVRSKRSLSWRKKSRFLTIFIP